jgi:aspartyl-tRNA(Asn)/glutamyl-tRNA(Gln) amidotransferase subunit C
MSQSPTSAQKIASLARIELTDEESSKVQSEFDTILEYIHQLDKVEIPEGTEPFFGATESTNAVREDSVVPSFDREEILKNAPDSDGEFYRVPPVL